MNKQTLIDDYKQTIEYLREENETLQAQVETFKNLMSVYKDISKGRQDSKYVTNYITALKYKLKIAEKVLANVVTQTGYRYCKFCQDNIIKAMQKMEEVGNE